MIRPIESLAFSMHANPGVYAVLAGSGVSRAARIPTGWEITLNLVQRLAAVRQQKCDPEPEEWYRNTFGKEPDYSELLDDLTSTPTERQALLRAYIEPNADELDEGTKQPTAAHHAIAALAGTGMVRVVLTTNFDRLIEKALEDTGITPTVLSTPEQVQGTRPLIHGGCWVVKLHGDYLDTRIRNTQAELDSYDPKFTELLDCILDEFGLIVCGWSAVWDGALRDALYRAPTRRFTTYWAVHGAITDEARRLIDHRAAKSIPITDADEFFTTVQENVESLREFARPHPLSTEAAVASLKRYLPEPQHRIRLSDLVDEAVEQVIEETSGEAFPMHAPQPNTKSVTARVRQYEAVSSRLLALAPIAGRWSEDDQVSPWQRALSRLGSLRTAGGVVIWLNLRRYPAALLLYALGIGAMEANRLEFLARLLKTPISEEYCEDKAAVQALLPFSLFREGGQVMRILTGMDRRYAPLNDWMHEALRPHAARVVRDETQYELTFDKLEILMALAHTHMNSGYAWSALGAFGYRTDNRNRIVREITESLSSQLDNSPFVRCGMFGDTVDVCKQTLDALLKCVAETRWY